MIRFIVIAMMFSLNPDALSQSESWCRYYGVTAEGRSVLRLDSQWAVTVVDTSKGGFYPGSFYMSVKLGTGGVVGSHVRAVIGTMAILSIYDTTSLADLRMAYTIKKGEELSIRYACFEKEGMCGSYIMNIRADSLRPLYFYGRSPMIDTGAVLIGALVVNSSGAVVGIIVEQKGDQIKVLREARIAAVWLNARQKKK